MVQYPGASAVVLVEASVDLTSLADLPDSEDLVDLQGSADLEVHPPMACQVDSLDSTCCEGWKPGLEQPGWLRQPVVWEERRISYMNP